MLDALERDDAQEAAIRIGLTGAPGAGKSTLVDALVSRARRRDETVGVVAVDPSSRRTGGALLGDRIRVRSGAADPGVFFRSLAARRRLGGLADSARAAILILGAAFDRVLVETVGVGQSEGEVADLVDTLIFVAQPGAGDLLQSMKAGVLELPDIIAVNKADLGAIAERSATELEAGIRLGEASGWRQPVLRVSAQEGTGLPELEEAIDAHRAWATQSGNLSARRLRGRDRSVEESLVLRYGSFGLEAIGGSSGLEERLSSASEASGARLFESLATEIERRITRGREEGDPT